MGRQRRDGSVQSSNLPIYHNLSKHRVEKDYGIYRCMVTKVFFTDSLQNNTFINKQVTYEVVILGGPKEGQILANVKAQGLYGGEFNYSERVFRPVETKELSSKRLAEHKGDIVFVAFLQGNTRAPIILGGGVQPFDTDSTGATKEDGFRMRKEYNGVFEEINKTGEWELRRKGGELNEDTGVLVPSSEFEAKIKFSDNKMLWADPKSSILFEKEEERWTHKVGSDGYTETIDGKNKKVTQKVGNCEVVIDGGSNKITITAGSTILEIDGASGKISIKGDMVDIGASVSDFAVLFTELSSAFNSHTHMVPVTGGSSSGSYPSQPPMAPLLQSVGSTTVKVQS